MSPLRLFRRAPVTISPPAPVVEPAIDPLAVLADRVEIARNFIIETENYYIEGYLFRESGAIFLTFEHAGGPQVRLRKYREGWGAAALRLRQVDHVAVKPKRADWYTRPDLPEVLAQLRPLFARYDRVVPFGGSMGGFAALTFADLVGATTVIAITPQSTLDQAKVPWDDRFPPALDCDFSGPYGDAVGKSASAAQVLVVLDRFCEPDMRHLARLQAANVQVLNLPFMGHTLAVDLQRMGLLAYLITSVGSGSFSTAEFHAIARRRREIPHYLEALHDRAQTSPARRRITARHLPATRAG